MSERNVEARQKLLPAVVAALLLPFAGPSSSTEELRDDQKGLVVVEESAIGVLQPPAGVPAGAVELQAGEQYASGTRVRSSADGLSFVIPEEWLGGLPPASAAVVLGPNPRPGLGLAITRAAARGHGLE